MYSESKRVDFLDSLRGLAALFVLLSHTVAAFDWPSAYFQVLGWPFIDILFDGKCAVAMFFVLSGYVLSKPYVNPAAPRQIFLPTFYLRRFTRIWLPWFFVFWASVVARDYFFHSPATQPPTSAWLGQFWGAALTWGDFFRQCSFTLHDSSRQLLNQDWSLGVELKGSALIPLFVFLLPRKRLGWLILLAALFLTLVGNGHYYVSFIIGVLIARYGEFWVPRLQRLNRRAKILLLFLGLGVYQGFSLAVRAFGATPAAVKYGWVVTALGCAAVMLSVFSSPSAQRFLNHKALVFLGRISYSVYLLQFIIILCVLPSLVGLCNHGGIQQRPWLFALTLLVSVGLTVVSSAITYRCIEVPAINVGHRLTKKIQQCFQK